MTKYRFDEIAINSTQKKKPTEEDKVYYIGLEHIDPGCFDVVRWGSDVAPTGDKLLMQKGDVLFGKRRAYQRKVAIAPFDGIFSAHGMVLRPNLKVIDANYFPFFISSDKFMDTAVRISVGGLSPTINWKDLARQEFELPSLDEQKVLAYKLWAAYRLKEAYKKLLVATDEIVKSQYLHRMAATEGFSIEISSRYDGWWRYNAALMCGYFDAGDERIGFASAESHVADVGANLTAKPADMAGDRSLRLETAACDHLLLYIYIVPHTLPAGNDIADTQPFEITLRIAYGGKVLRSEKRLINQWSGASVEMRVDRQDK